MEVVKETKPPFEGSYKNLSGEMVVQIVEDKGKYITRCQITRHPKSNANYSTDTNINAAMDKYTELTRLAKL